MHFFRQADPDLPAIPAELNGIGYQIDQHLPYRRGVPYTHGRRLFH